MESVVWADFLAEVAGVLLSLGMAYAPGLSERWAGLDGSRKRLAMLGLLALAVLGVFGLSCLGWWAELGGGPGASAGSGAVTTGFACSRSGALGLTRAFILALMANQATYSLLPRQPERREAWGGVDGR